MSVVFVESAFISVMEQGANLQIREWPSGLKAYSALFKKRTKLALPKVLGSTTWEHLDALFQLRNHLVHGLPLIIETHSENEKVTSAQHLTKIGGVETFLVKAKVIEKKKSQHRSFSDFLSPSVATWAWQIAKTAVQTFAESRPGESRRLFDYLNLIDGISFDSNPRS